MKEFIAKMMQGTFCPHANVYRTRLFIVHGRTKVRAVR